MKYEIKVIFFSILFIILETIECKEIIFRQAMMADKELIFSWMSEPYVQEFWDNSQEHWDNVLHYLQGTKDIYDYWIGVIDNVPYCLILTSDPLEYPNEYYAPYFSTTGKTRTLDFMIGNKHYLGKGLGAETLTKFITFLKTLDMNIDTFIIDPMSKNAKAIHVYQKTGFIIVGEFTFATGYFAGIQHTMMIKKI